ncbi:MAG: translation elongation factor Ts [Planctomycetes bacterium]|nr:translation elongation factor Ts [Planctomycetota bacterium]
MAAITAQLVKDLREKTDLPMMECKQALTECNGDMESAVEWLRRKHKGKLADRSGRVTGEGRVGIYISEDRKTGAIIELQCETAPVAKNELFVGLANAFARKVAHGTAASPDPQAVRGDAEMDHMFTDVFGRLRESMNLAQCRRVTGNYLTSYVHHDGKSGVLLALDAAPKSDKNIGADLCMHTLFSMPIAVDRNSVPAAEVEKVRAAAIDVAKTEGKPESIVAKIAEGKVNAFYAERVLLEQFHVKTDDYGKAKVGDVLKAAGVKTVTDMVIMKVGA